VVLVLGTLAAACGSGGVAAPGSSGGAGGVDWVELDPGALDVDKIAAIAEAATGDASPVTMTEPEAREVLPFAYELPAWVPEGFAAVEEVEVVQPAGGEGYSSLGVVWETAEEDYIHLQIASGDATRPSVAGAGQMSEVTVAGQPARVVTSPRGEGERTSLSWKRDNLTFTLSTEASTVTIDDLVRMAESIP
jgi:hypothetical protein